MRTQQPRDVALAEGSAVLINEDAATILALGARDNARLVCDGRRRPN